ncbi:hypothetical protein P5673_011721, partial [Acropora cervicornis]
MKISHRQSQPHENEKRLNYTCLMMIWPKLDNQENQIGYRLAHKICHKMAEANNVHMNSKNEEPP